MNPRCRTCGGETQAPNAERCDGCWEVESRLPDYLRTAGGRVFAKRLLRRIESEDNRVFECGQCGGGAFVLSARVLVQDSGDRIERLTATCVRCGSQSRFSSPEPYLLQQRVDSSVGGLVPKV
jgi:hypothetical protein